MMVIKLILLQVIAHLLSDFIFQPQRWCDKKESKIFTSIHLYHVMVVGAMSYLLSFDFGFWKAAILLAAVHLLIDMFKSWLILKNKTKSYFFFDQLIHLVAIAGIVLAYSHYYDINFVFYFEIKTIAVIAAFIFCAKPSNIFIKYLFKAFSIETPKETTNDPNDQSLPNAGKLIGIVERLLALALIIVGQYEAVGLIIAAKSILRFNGTQKSEYVLIGTLLSFGIAASLGIFINLMK
jgi:hypothetical protein